MVINMITKIKNKIEKFWDEYTEGILKGQINTGEAFANFFRSIKISIKSKKK